MLIRNCNLGNKHHHQSYHMEEEEVPSTLMVLVEVFAKLQMALLVVAVWLNHFPDQRRCIGHIECIGC